MGHGGLSLRLVCFSRETPLRKLILYLQVAINFRDGDVSVLLSALEPHLVPTHIGPGPAAQAL